MDLFGSIKQEYGYVLYFLDFFWTISLINGQFHQWISPLFVIEEDGQSARYVAGAALDDSVPPGVPTHPTSHSSREVRKVFGVAADGFPKMENPQGKLVIYG